MGRDCVVVIGMHRSGTSAMARSMSLLGAHLPRHLIAADPGNPAGHWEPEPLVRLHDRLMSEVGSRWDDWRALNLEPDLVDRYTVEATTLLADEFPADGIAVIKDPRISRFVDAFTRALDAADFCPRWIVMHRHPLEVAESLAKRNTMAPGAAQLIWLRHQLDAERATRGRERTFVSYDALLRDWRAVLDSTTRSLDLRLPVPVDDVAAELDAFLSGEHRHHRAAEDAVPLNAWVSDAHAALSALTLDAADADAMARLDSVRDAFASVPAIFDEATASIQAHASNLSQRAAAREQQVARAAADHRAELARRTAAHNAERARLVRAHRRDMRRLTTTLTAAQTRLVNVRRSRSWRWTQPGRRVMAWVKRHLNR